MAVNIECLRCFTYARAVCDQIAMDDPDDLSWRAWREVLRLNVELHFIRWQAERGRITIEQTMARIDEVVADFHAFADELRAQVAEDDGAVASLSATTTAAEDEIQIDDSR